MGWKRLGVVALQELTQSYIKHMWEPLKKAGIKRSDVNRENLHELDIELKARGYYGLVDYYHRTQGISDFYNFLQSYLYAHNSKGHCKLDPKDCSPSRFYIEFFGLNSLMYRAKSNSKL